MGANFSRWAEGYILDLLPQRPFYIWNRGRIGSGMAGGLVAVPPRPPEGPGSSILLTFDEEWQSGIYWWWTR